ncbi:receptor-like protein kinase At3g21340 [Oryza brachyantha]|uniref:receptor-like protein kinase At3g21340 n=1 Tax=Oryza brachyantha TaxID=4533 RepID=UPI001ADACF5A|nr:receptor-like protein kinase At3g21340 [Oryza brachyantha]
MVFMHGSISRAHAAGFLSIDCGLEANFSGYKADDTGIIYVSDGPYVDTGENRRMSAKEEGPWPRPYRTLRSFPSGVRNCYSLPTVAGAKYLLRLVSIYGDYDGRGSASAAVQFDVHLGANYWVTVSSNPTDGFYEALFVAWASWAPVCLVNTGRGTPFVNALELRALSGELYPAVMANQSITLVERINMGSNITISRYPLDKYDRRWWLMQSSPTWNTLFTASTIQQSATYALPLAIMQTAVEAAVVDGTLVIARPHRAAMEYKAFLHFADFQNSRRRQFSVSFNKQGSYQVSPPYLATDTLHSSFTYKAADGVFQMTLTATSDSMPPPMLNAFELYTVISQGNPMTFPIDFNTIMAIKIEYGIKKNWMGDPCFPTQFSWDGVKCGNVSGNNTARIISLDLSYSNLHGVISNNFTLLTALEYLNLSCNLLNGPIPDSLHKNNTGSFIFSFDSDGDMCKKIIEPSPTRNKSKMAIILVILVVVPLMAIAVLVLAYMIWRDKRKLKRDPSREPADENVLASTNNHVDALPKVDNRQFTYKEIEKLTNNLKQFIGQGGFGPVYYGRLEDGTEVAVKMRSDSSAHGLDEFFAEVQSLTKVHHRNLVSLVGYCSEKDHLALVYEYMAQGSLNDHLRGNKHAGEGLNWRTRVRVVIEAGQGLDYLHRGCSLPIIHRDVKSSNILLSQNLQAKLADFGLSKSYLSETQTHISITPAGTAGYMDPEYFYTSRLTESSDVYSFGIVLLEIATGESPILPGLGHIIQRVKNKITAGNISLIADARLGGAYEVNSMWKVLDIALLCTTDIGAQRPTMAAVLAQLKESLALEETRLDNIFSGTTGTSDSTVSSDNFGPLAR